MLKGGISESSYENASIGARAVIEPDVEVGFKYHGNCGPAILGEDANLRKGTVIYGDTIIGDHFQAGYYSVVRAMVKPVSYTHLRAHETGRNRGRRRRLEKK